MAVMAPPGDSLGLRTPGVGRERQTKQRSLLGADGDDGAELLLLHRLAQHRHGRMKAPVETNREHDAGRFGCNDRGLRIGERQGDGLLDEHGFAGGGRAFDLVGVQGMRRGEHDGVDRWVSQDHVQIVDPVEVVLAAEIGDGGRGAGMRGGEADGLAVPH